MDSLQLSEELINDLSDALSKHDPRADDPGVAVQYLAAVLGFLVGHMGFEHEEKREFLQQLSGFAMHVFEDVSTPEEKEPAAGIWKPGD